MENRFPGCLLGLATGDAVGTTVEFKQRGTFVPLTDMTGGGPFSLKPGQWTDDTSMALCLAHSLIYRRGFDPVDQMNRYCNWWQLGYLSSTDRCFDIGITVSTALQKYLDTQNPFSGSTAPRSAGNGSLMRLAPVPMYYCNSLEKTIHYSAESSRTTHGALECIDACRYFGALLYSALQGADKEALIHRPQYQPETVSIGRIAAAEYLDKTADQIKGSGYVVESLEAAMWCFATTNSFREAVLAAANLGDDADTTAAICGQIAGAYYTLGGIPEEWLAKLSMRNEIELLARELYRFSDESD